MSSGKMSSGRDGTPWWMHELIEILAENDLSRVSRSRDDMGVIRVMSRATESLVHAAEIDADSHEIVEQYYIRVKESPKGLSYGVERCSTDG